MEEGKNYEYKLWVPWLRWRATHNSVEMWIKFEVIFIQILKQIFSAKYFSDLYQLVVIIVTVKERFLPENHARKHASQ